MTLIYECASVCECVRVFRCVPCILIPDLGHVWFALLLRILQLHLHLLLVLLLLLLLLLLLMHFFLLSLSKVLNSFPSFRTFALNAQRAVSFTQCTQQRHSL